MAMDPVMKKALEVARVSWGNASKRAVTEGFGSDVEDGRYVAQIVEAKLGMSKTSSRLQVAWKYKILDGEMKGKTKMDWDGADTEDNQMWLGRKLAKLGFEIPGDLEEVEGILKEIEKNKVSVRITVKTKGEFQKVYVDEVLSAEDLEGLELEVAAAPAAEVEPEAEGEALEVGAKVSFAFKGETLEGEVVEILESENKARVKTEKGTFKLAPDALTLVEEVPEEPEVETEVEPEPEVEEPKKVVKKAPAKKEIKKKR